MPIEKRPVVHRFGIFTEARRDELVQKVVLDDHQFVSSCLKSSINYPQRIDEKLNELNSALTEMQLLSLEDEASILLEKIRFKVVNIDTKNGLQDLKECWNDLSLFISCKSQKLQHGAIVLLRKSLCDAPLSKWLVSTLLDILLSNLEVFFAIDRSHLWDSKYFLLAEVIFLICSRLYYHYLVRDSRELPISKLVQLSLLNKTLNNTIILYQDNPILKNVLDIIRCIIIYICPMGVPSILDENSSQFEDKEKQKSIMNPSISYLDPTSSGSERSPLARFLWYCLKLWKCASRQVEAEREIIDKLCLVDFFAINTNHEQWLDYIFSFYILCECAKLKLEFLKLFLQFRTKMSPKNKSAIISQRNSVEKYETIWSLELIVIYLRCLADVCMFAISISTQKLALVGDENMYGLIDYLLYIPEDENSSKIKVCAYQLLDATYSFYQTDSMKDGLRNIAWNNIMKFKSYEQCTVTEQVKHHQVRTVDSYQSIGSIFSKIGTNLCVIAFPTCVSYVKSRENSKCSNRRPKNSKCFERETHKIDGESTKMQAVKSKLPSKPPREQETWTDVQRIAAGHFEKELEEDEIELERLHKEADEDDHV